MDRLRSLDVILEELKLLSSYIKLIWWCWKTVNLTEKDEGQVHCTFVCLRSVPGRDNRLFLRLCQDVGFVLFPFTAQFMGT